MTTGQFELREQAGSRGYFGRVSLQAEPQVNGEFEVKFAEDLGSEWQSAARFGVDYFLEHIPKKKVFPTGLRVTISEIVGHPVDTTHLVIAFVTVNALSQALQDQVTLKKLPTVNLAGGTFEFPK
jgi:hypothetical protein